MVWATSLLKNYKWGTRIRVATNHHFLCCLLKKRDLAGRLVRLSLGDRSTKWSTETDSDSLSHQPVGEPVNDSDIPFLSFVYGVFRLNIDPLPLFYIKIKREKIFQITLVKRKNLFSSYFELKLAFLAPPPKRRSGLKRAVT